MNPGPLVEKPELYPCATFTIMLTQRIIDYNSGWLYLADNIGCCCEKVDLEILSASQFRGFILSLNLFNEGPPDKSIGKCPPGGRFETEAADSTILAIRKQNLNWAKKLLWLEL